MDNFKFFGTEFNLSSEQGLLELIHKLNASHKDIDSAINAAVARTMELLEAPHNNKRIARLLLESVTGSKNRHIKAKGKKLLAFIDEFAWFVDVEELDKGSYRLAYTAIENDRYYSREVPVFSQWEYKPVAQEKPATPITSKALDGLKRRLAVSDPAIIQELRLALEELESANHARKDAGNALEEVLKQEQEQEQEQQEEQVLLTEIESEAEKLRNNEKVA